jgi:hypothetical protein
VTESTYTVPATGRSVDARSGDRSRGAVSRRQRAGQRVRCSGTMPATGTGAPSTPLMRVVLRVMAPAVPVSRWERGRHGPAAPRSRRGRMPITGKRERGARRWISSSSSSPSRRRSPSSWRSCAGVASDSEAGARAFPLRRKPHAIAVRAAETKAHPATVFIVRLVTWPDSGRVCGQGALSDDATTSPMAGCPARAGHADCGVVGGAPSTPHCFRFLSG